MKRLWLIVPVLVLLGCASATGHTTVTVPRARLAATTTVPFGVILSALAAGEAKKKTIIQPSVCVSAVRRFCSNSAPGSIAKVTLTRCSLSSISRSARPVTRR